MKSILAATRTGIALLLCAFCLVPVASAHPGRTDANGGHTDRSTGEYHYHHGYGPHQHENGECPYNFVDATDHDSGGGDSSSKEVLVEDPTPSEFCTSYPQEAPEEEEGSWFSRHPNLTATLIIFSVCILIPIAIVVALSIENYFYAKRVKKEKQQRRIRWNDLYEERPFSVAFSVPPEFTISDDGLPLLTQEPQENLKVYTVRRGGAYHKKGCVHAYGPSEPMWEAVRNGCKPCRMCYPPQYDFSWYWEYLRVKREMESDGVSLVIENGILYLRDKKEDQP